MFIVSEQQAYELQRRCRAIKGGAVFACNDEMKNSPN